MEETSLSTKYKIKYAHDWQKVTILSYGKVSRITNKIGSKLKKINCENNIRAPTDHPVQ